MTPDDALLALGRALRERAYRFITPTPATHARVNARPEHAVARSREDILGWSRPFRAADFPELAAQLAAADALAPAGDLVRSTVRFSTVPSDTGEPGLFVHSAYPTLDAASVFFGPDTYRYIRLLREVLRPAHRLVDLGAGSGAGALSVADRAERLVLSDINPAALRLARINAALAGRAAEVLHSDLLQDITGPIDAIIANPPYLADPAARVYRDGGGALGIDLSVRIVRDALARLAPGGQLVLYTGSPVLAGAHPLFDAIAPLLAGHAARCSELDPDVFGEELDTPAYAHADRIAVVAVVVTRT